MEIEESLNFRKEGKNLEEKTEKKGKGKSSKKQLPLLELSSMPVSNELEQLFVPRKSGRVCVASQKVKENGDRKS